MANTKSAPAWHLLVHHRSTVPNALKFVCRLAKSRGWSLEDLTFLLNQTWEDMFPDPEGG